MEKKVLPLIIFAFVCEVTLFLHELELLPLPYASNLEIGSEQTPIGNVTWTKQNVQRKHSDSIVWQDSQSNQTLYGFDSVLTLKDSSAKLELDGNINIDLQENTLIVLEPPADEKSRSFRIRFQKGHLRSRTSKDPLRLATGEWTVETSNNTDIALQSLADGEIGIEVKSGQAKLKKPEGLTTKMESGTRIQLSPEKVLKTQKISEALKWDLQNQFINHYAHVFPVPLELKWRGEAKRMSAVNSRGETLSFPLPSDLKTKTLDLSPGTWSFRLEAGEEASESLVVNIYPAGKIMHLYPLPRSRVDVDAETRFSWAPSPVAKSYKLMLTPKDIPGEPIVHLTSSPNHMMAFEQPGLFEWQVIAIDESGFEIPSYYIYQLDVLETPLAPPSLKNPFLNQKLKPKIRKPAHSKQSLPDGAKLLKKIWSQILPSAHAEEKTYVRSLVISWFPVPGADHYVLEISEDPSFRDLLRSEQVRDTEFLWQGFELKTVYYRVAAGKDNGRKGIFSEPQKIQLEKLKTLTLSQDLQPGIRVKVTEITPDLKEQVLPKKKKEEKPAAKLEKKKEQAKVEKKIEPLASDIHWRIGGFWSSGFIVNSQTNSDNVTVNQEGFFLTRFGFNFSLPFFGLGHLRFDSDFLEAPWTLEEDSDFQSELTQKDQTYSLSFGSTGKTSDYGIFYKTYSLAKRESNESVRIEEIHPLGLAYFFRYGFTEFWKSKHMLGLGHGDQYFHVQSDNFVYTNLLLWDDNYAKLGFEFNVRYGSGEESQSYLGTAFLFRLGMEF